MWGAYVMWLLHIGGAGTRGPTRLLAREVALGLLLATPLLMLGLAGVEGLAWSIVAAASVGIVMLRACVRYGRSFTAFEAIWHRHAGSLNITSAGGPNVCATVPNEAEPAITQCWRSIKVNWGIMRIGSANLAVRLPMRILPKSLRVSLREIQFSRAALHFLTDRSIRVSFRRG